jgi:hypothetical protein
VKRKRSGKISEKIHAASGDTEHWLPATGEQYDGFCLCKTIFLSKINAINFRKLLQWKEIRDFMPALVA